MATEIALLLTLFWVIAVQGQDVIIVEVPENQPVTYHMENITMLADDACSIQTPMRAQPYDLYPSTGDLPASLEYFNPQPQLENRGCGFKINNALVSDTGNWTLILNTTENIIEKVTLRDDLSIRVVVKTWDIVPRSTVNIVSGHDLYLRFATSAVGNLVECRVNWTAGDHEVVLRPGIVVDPLVGYWGSGLKEECGVRATGIGLNDGGVWKLLATNTTSHVILGEFTVKVLNATTTYVENDQTFIEGHYSVVNMGAENSKYCQAMFPNGTMDKVSGEQCDVKLQSVTKASEGRWGARFGVPEQMDELTTTSQVDVVPVESYDTSITESPRINGALDLLFQWTTYQPSITTALFCRFTRPDGMALSLEDGVGNANYSYYGDGLNFSGNIKYCGLTIIKPRDEDRGTWQCVIGANLSQLKSSFIHVPPATKDRQTNSSSKSDVITVTGGEKEVIVKNGSALTISCRATESLSYCWFAHPNGTILTPITNKPGNVFYYSGRGLGFGECSITISISSLTDDGKWMCNMGLPGLPDIQVPVTARVTGSNLIGPLAEVEFTKSDKSGADSLAAICKSVPNGIAMQYCRFVRPDGTGFGFTKNDDVVMERYRYEGAGLEFGDCGLRISPVLSEDFGQWTCAALLLTSYYDGPSVGDSSFYIADRNEISGGAVAGIVIGCILAVVLIGIGLLYVCRRTRRLSAQSAEMENIN